CRDLRRPSTCRRVPGFAHLRACIVQLYPRSSTLTCHRLPRRGTTRRIPTPSGGVYVRLICSTSCDAGLSLCACSFSAGKPETTPAPIRNDVTYAPGALLSTASEQLHQHATGSPDTSRWNFDVRMHFPLDDQTPGLTSVSARNARCPLRVLLPSHHSPFFSVSPPFYDDSGSVSSDDIDGPDLGRISSCPYRSILITPSDQDRLSYNFALVRDGAPLHIIAALFLIDEYSN
ncbi:hypothetical protein F4802DRAFT_613696, partial [Xylaria palmicola]